MDKQTVKIYTLSIWIDSKELKIREKEYEYKVTEKSYINKDERVRLNKYKIMKIDTIFIERHNSIRYHTFCFENQRDEAKKLLLDFVTEKVNQYKKEIDYIYSILTKCTEKP